MNKPIHTVADLGLVLRAARKSQQLRLDDLAGIAGVGHIFAREVEHGKETVQMGRVLRLLQELGVELSVKVPSDAIPYLKKLEESGLKPLKSRTQVRPPKSAQS